MAINESSIPNGSSQKATICVFCGSSAGASPAYLEAAKALAHALHTYDINLVYGGGTTGMMGTIAKTLVSLSGPSAVHGIIPEALVKYEQANKGTAQGLPGNNIESFGKTTIVKDMHTRKQLMVKSVVNGGPGSGFIALSGGYGTMEELMEVTTWHQLGIHDMGVCIFNVNGFYDGLISWIRRVTQEGFVPITNANIIVEAKTAKEAIDCLSGYEVADGRCKLDWPDVKLEVV